MKPNGNRLVVEILKSKSKITMAECKDRPLRGEVLFVGDCTAKVGDIVWVNAYAGDDFKYEGKECKIVREESVLLYE